MLQPSKTSESKELPVIAKLYDLILWSHNHIAKFPNRVRNSLGNRMESCLLDILDFLLEAKFSKLKSESLKSAALGLEKLRFQFRLCYDTRVLSHQSHRHACHLMLEIGKQIQGWIRHVENGN